MPLQPLDDGAGPEVGPLGQVGLADDDRAGGLQLLRDERVVGRAPGECPGAGCRRHAGGVDVVLDDDRNPEQRTVVAVASRPVGRSCVRAGRRADRDHRVELRVELVDAPEIEVRQLDGVHPVRVHQLLELRDRRRVDVDTGDLGVSSGWPRCRSRRGAGYPEQEGQQGRQNKETPQSAAHRVTSTGSGGWTLGSQGWDRRSGAEFYNRPAVNSVGGIDHAEPGSLQGRSGNRGRHEPTHGGHCRRCSWSRTRTCASHRPRT